MSALDWALVALAIVVCAALYWDAHAQSDKSDNDDNEVDRMIALGQQPGSWEP